MTNKTAYFFLLVFSAILFLSINPEKSQALIPLHTNGCGFNQEMVGKYGVAVNGVGTFDSKTAPKTYSDSFAINVGSGSTSTPVKAYLYWSIRYRYVDPTINIRINNGSFSTVTAKPSPNGILGPAPYGLPFVAFQYTTYIVDLGSYIGGANGIKSGNNNITITKTMPASADVADYDLFGVGMAVIYQDNTLPDQHLELRCGMDVTFANHGYGSSTPAKWGPWSDVVCHEFEPSTAATPRQVNYYAFMSGTHRKDASHYRPNAFWYVTGIGNGSIPGQITGLNRSFAAGGNLGMNTLPTGPSGFNVNHKDDLFDANKGNQWDTIDTENDPSTITLSIPQGHDYICFQTQSRNAPTISGQYGLGSSMQWSMSALTFNYSGATVPPTPTTPGPTAVPSGTPIPPTVTPTPIIYHPWLATIGGNVHSEGFSQANLALLGPTITNTSDFDGTDIAISKYLYTQISNSSVPARSSASNFYLNDYTDNNATFKGNTWFNYFNSSITQANFPDAFFIEPGTYGVGTGVVRVSELDGVSSDPNQVLVFKISSFDTYSLSICDRKAIFIITGNLTFHTNFETEGPANGCMFVVGGTTYITQGPISGSTGTLTNYDEIHAYIITDHMVTEEDPMGDGLHIKGGIVTNTTDFNRSLGNTRNLYAPGEMIEFDPRYIYIYGDMVSYSFGYNIRESQFINSIE